MTQFLPCVEIEPTGATQAGSVVWLHGLGASGHDFEPIVPMLQLPDVRFVFPHAPSIPVTINGGMVMPAWYDILTLEQTGLRENEAQIRSSSALVVALVQRERERGVDPGRIVLAGFSQGGAMALHVGNRYPDALAGVMVLSGYHLVPDTLEAERSGANVHTPMLFCHGTFDPLVPLVRGRRAHDDMATDGREIAWHDFPMQHEVCPPEIGVIARWLRDRLPPV